jgi:hypothetical protein
MRIEVYRNKPAGKRCNILTENVLQALTEIVEEFNEVELRILHSNEIRAPAISIDGKVVGENLSMEEIIEKFSSDELIEYLRKALK